MSKTTSLDNLFLSNEEIKKDPETFKNDLESFKKYKDHELMMAFIDINYDKETRFYILEELTKRDYLLGMECINNVITMYINNTTSFIKNVLLEICYFNEFNFTLRIRCIQSLDEVATLKKDKKLIETCDEIFVNVMSEVVKESSEYKKKYEVSTVYFWDIYKLILSRETIQNNTEKMESVIQIGQTILLQKDLNEEFRYKLLQTICNVKNIKNGIKTELCNCFYKNNFEDYKYYIFILQLIQKYEGTIKNEQIDDLFTIIKTKSLDNNGIADICDFILSLNDEEYVERAKTLLDEISFDGLKKKTIYNNSQNIHKVNVDLKSFTEKLLTVDLTVYKVPSIENEDEFSNYLSIFMKEIENKANLCNIEIENVKKIKTSIKRCILDNTLYSEYYLSLIQLLIRTYYYILSHPYKDELLPRLFQELEEMADTCSTGHIIRLVNIFSGYEDVVSIPIEDEIKACIFARLEKIIYEKTDEEQDLIFECMGSSESIKGKEKKTIDTVSSIVGSFKRKDAKGNEITEVVSEEDIDKEALMVKQEDPEIVFLNLLGKDINNISEELKKEYVESKLIDEQMFIVYLRRGISAFQMGEKV